MVPSHCGLGRTLGPVGGGKRLCILTHGSVDLSRAGGLFPPPAGTSAHVLQCLRVTSAGVTASAGLVGAPAASPHALGSAAGRRHWLASARPVGPAGVPGQLPDSPWRPGSAEVVPASRREVFLASAKVLILLQTVRTEIILEAIVYRGFCFSWLVKVPNGCRQRRRVLRCHRPRAGRPGNRTDVGGGLNPKPHRGQRRQPRLSQPSSPCNLSAWPSRVVSGFLWAWRGARLANPPGS